MIAILIPAAGRSTRMGGRDKLLEPVDGMALLRRQAVAALSVTDDVLVTLPKASGSRAEALAGLRLQQVIVADPSEGMSASLRTGAKAVPDGADLMVVPADMPGIGAAAMAAVAQAREAHPEARIWRGATEDGVAGHPVLFHSALLHAFSQLSGDKGAREIAGSWKERTHLVPLPGDAAVLDLDTPEEWAAWRERGQERR